jgi:hypothetical protein
MMWPALWQSRLLDSPQADENGSMGNRERSAYRKGPEDKENDHGNDSSFDESQEDEKTIARNSHPPCDRP